MAERLAGRRALITGAASGIGAATAARFAAEGAAVALADLPSAQERAAEVAARISAAGGTAIVLPVDVCDEDSVARAVAETVQRLGGLDTVVASAGVFGHPRQGSFTRLLDLDRAHWQFVLDVNLTGVFATLRHAAAHMVAAGGGGSLITLASMAAKRPTTGVYSVSKAAVWMLTRAFALELAPHRVRANAIGPGYVRTPLLDGMASSSGGDDAEGWLRTRAEQVPLGRLGEPDDVARVAVFLASDDSAYVTGSIFHPDGGVTSLYAGG